jgi:hypothetical protein
MKVIIDIPEDHKKVIDNLVEDGKGYLLPHEVENKMALAIRNGKVLSDMTNGDMIKALFNIEIVDDLPFSYGVELTDSNYVQYDKEWWNTPYKAKVVGK